MSTTEPVLYLSLLAATLLASALGLIIVFQAFRGYRRNDSQRMLYLAVGLALITVAPFGLSIVFTLFAPGIGNEEFLLSYVLPMASRLLEISGLGLILYSLYRT
ncbi:hypothetical protein SAMN05192561_12710 [Halopenitus malekzadehii]|uniref:Uncharacterized protein n=1 Tax=Halopenitus malekzadehii TaxID=1267564 RepID=A0A1H6JWS8_9EURY|nr:hypothetical protein [Halopenitus malekzadehii]SEH67061.1 hypothetical protein SAMN05192561_12710 [Halopenitus malekzadehii]